MDCVINLDKPEGFTSYQAVEKARRLLRARKAGHAGTLDPIATGILLICTGEGTKITRFLSDLDKEYFATMKLGESTDTFDSEGKVVQRCEGFSLERREIEEVIGKFTGAIEQAPPMYSAVKMNGKPLYKLARKGITIEVPKRRVMVRSIEITGVDHPFLEVKVSCSKGTYIRSLCHDIGEALGVGAHLTGLRRTRIGNFTVPDSATMEELEELVRMKGPEIPCGGASMSRIDDALAHLREISLSAGEFSKARNGYPIKVSDGSFSPGEYVRLKDPRGALFAVGNVTNGLIRIVRMLHLSGQP